MSGLADFPPLRFVKRSLDGVTAMWSEPADPRGLAFCRLLLFWHSARELDAGEYGRYMLVGELAWKPHSYFQLFHVTPPSPSVAHFLCVAYAVAGYLAMSGTLYRVSAPVTAGLSLYLHGILENFGKTLHTYHLFSLALLILALSRAGDVWSVDSLVKRGLASRKGQPPPRVEPSAEYRWPLLMVGSTILVMYGAAGFSKLYITGWDWALSDSFRQTLLQGQFDAKPPTQIGVWLAEHPDLCQALALGALLGEATAWIGLTNRYLYWVCASLVVLLQFGIWVLMGVTFGELPTMFAFFLPWNFLIRKLDALLRRLRPLPAPSA
jgi:hypothetical protein